ncbi:F-box protein At5g07610-like [Bidens hawaiensis]|uniref:F-box protein At5g07610-like n=1 Tax=Bidens hawaiensis TaxID=980011 RepID=UPI004048EBF4
MEDSDNQFGALVSSSEGLLTEILIRLPAASILRFKSVSKHWQLLLTHVYFTNRYDNNFLKSLGIFVGNIYVPFDAENKSTPPFNSRIDFYFNISGFRIIQSCNGLLLCYTDHYGPHEYYVLNPTTKQLAIIPTLKKTIIYMALAFHQTRCVHYKLVCIVSLEASKRLIQIQVYLSDTRTWKICVESFHVHNTSFHDPVYWNGAVYWPPRCGNRNCLYFKIDVEKLQLLPLVDYETLMYFGESRGHLHFILRMKPEENSLIVCEMLMYHSGWFVKYRVQLDELLSAFPEMVHQYGYNFLVVDVVRGKEEEDTFLVLYTSGKSIAYNVHDKSFGKLGSCDITYLHLLSFHRYIETLSSF